MLYEKKINFYENTFLMHLILYHIIELNSLYYRIGLPTDETKANIKKFNSSLFYFVKEFILIYNLF